MALNYYYNYAEIDPTTGMCIGVHSCTSPADNPNLIAIPEYDEELGLKYYYDGKWYYDAAHQNEYIPIWEQ